MPIAYRNMRASKQLASKLNKSESEVRKVNSPGEKTQRPLIRSLRKEWLASLSAL